MNGRRTKVQALITARIKELQAADLDPGSILEDGRFLDLMQLQDIVAARSWENMVPFSQEALTRLRRGENLPHEWIEFAFERICDAAAVAAENKKARNNPIASALYLSGRQSTYKKHMDIARQVCEKSFQFRHKKGKDAAINAAIDALDLGARDTVERIVKKHRKAAFLNMTVSDDTRIQEYAWNMLKKEYPHLPL
jgi:hypothetical protein